VDKPKAAPPEGGIDFGFGGPTGLFSKALRDVGKTVDIKSLETMGLDNDVVWQQVRNNCLRLALNNAKNQLAALDAFRVGYLQGEATVEAETEEGRTTLRVKQHKDGKDVSITARKILLCTGSKPTRPPDIPFDDMRIFDSDTVNGLGFLPRSVTIVGAGIIAIEYAKIFRNFGAEVTMLVRGSAMDALKRIGLDDTIATRLLQGLAEDDVAVLENTQIKEFVFCPDDGCEIGDEPQIGGNSCTPIKISLTNKAGDDLGIHESEIFLAAIGRRPVSRGTSLGLEEAGVTLTERSAHIEVNEKLQTSVGSIYAAGDCIVGPALASTGVDQAQRAVQYMFGSSNKEIKVTKDFPIGMWTIPEIGYYGLTKDKALEKGFEAEEGVATYDACLRGRVFAPDGMLKLVFDRESKQILGVHIIGTDACELVHYGMDLVDKEATIFDVIGTLFTAVTFHELFKEAALNGNSKLDFGIQWQEVLGQLADGLPDAELSNDELRLRFNEIDTSGDGSLDEEELKAVFDNIGEPVDVEVISNLIHLADEDGNGTIEWEEFVTIFEVLRKMQVSGQL